MNERLPEFKAEDAHAIMFPVPSMRVPARQGTGESEGLNVEYLIKKTLEEGTDEDGGIVERLADRIARGRAVTGRPRALKRFETA